MENYLMILIIIVIGFTIYFITAKNKVKKENKIEEQIIKPNHKALISKNNEDCAIFHETNPLVEINEIFELSKIDENYLVEIKDKHVIAEINAAVPKLAQIVLNHKDKKDIKVIKDSIEKAPKLYEAILPPGYKLVNSKELDNAKRGFARNKNNINKHANLKEYNHPKVKSSDLANAVSSAMNITSMVVGLYYMAEIDNQLKDISNKISDLQDFQKNTFKADMLSLYNEVKTITENRLETLGNEEERNRILQHLKTLESRSLKLTTEVNITIDKITLKTYNDLETYQKKSRTMYEYINYQVVLNEVMKKIGELQYIFNKSEMSVEYCFSNFYKALNESNECRNQLIMWHKKEHRELKIKIDKNRIRKVGLEGFVVKPLGLINKKFNYKTIDWRFAKEIKSQLMLEELKGHSDLKLYNENVKLIVKDGKYYYLPNKELNE